MGEDTRLKEVQAENKKQADAPEKLGHNTLAQFEWIDSRFEHLETKFG